MRFIFLLLFSSLFSSAQTGSANIQYQPPALTDAERLVKIRQALPAIDKLYKDYATRIHSPGFVYGVVVDGQLVGTGQTGFIQTGQRLAATTGSVFRIASMSKSFTAMAILQLRDAGRLRLDDSVSKYLPQFNRPAYPATDAAPVTIRHLLIHAAGFPEDNPWGDRQLAKTGEDLLALINNGIAYSNVPGVAYEYSNLGFTLLGAIIAKVSGVTYQQYINDNILKPLGMTNTFWEFADVPPNALAHGYRRVNGEWLSQPLLHDGAWGAMGGMLTTIEDFGKYMALHLAAWPPRNDAEGGPLKRASLREMHHPWNPYAFNLDYTYPSGRSCPTAIAYGYGLRWTKDCKGRVAIGHSGGLPGFGSNWQMLPEYGVGVVCFSNLTYAPTTAINTAVLDTLVALAGLKPRQGKPSSILLQRQQQLVKLLPQWDGSEASGIFAENFFLDYFRDSLRKEAMAVFEKAGRIVRVGEIVPENALRGTFLMEGERQNIAVYFTLTPEAEPKIQEYRLRAVAR